MICKHLYFKSCSSLTTLALGVLKNHTTLFSRFLISRPPIPCDPLWRFVNPSFLIWRVIASAQNLSFSFLWTTKMIITLAKLPILRFYNCIVQSWNYRLIIDGVVLYFFCRISICLYFFTIYFQPLAFLVMFSKTY